MSSPFGPFSSSGSNHDPIVAIGTNDYVVDVSDNDDEDVAI